MQNFDSIMSSALAQQQPNGGITGSGAGVGVGGGGGWYDMTIKSEPMDNSTTYSQPSYQHQHHHHHHNHNHHPQDTPMSHSSPTSPQSVDSMDSLGGRGPYYDAKTAGRMIHGYTPLGFNPLTPPGYAGMFVPPQQQQQQHQQLSRQSTPNRNYGKQDSGYVSSTLTPTHTPPMDVTPPKSPKEIVGTPEKEEDNGSDCEESYDGSEDEEGIRKPKINSHGKVKKFKCKQCDFVAVTKLSFWEHTRNHIKPEKMLTCPKCPFVTEYKHHLEYHLRNHQRSKPFQCPKCSYSCVNKSMLNSHMKSHSNVFQYRCADCNYATKYCHSLKLHLRKYSHKPDVVLNMDGTPNPLPIIDVYGTRRGPKTKSQKALQHKQETLQSQLPTQAPLTPQSHQPIPNHSAFTPPSAQSSNLPRNLLPHQILPNPLAHMFKSAAANNLSLFPYLNLNFQMFADQQAAMAQLSPNFHQQFANQFTDKLSAADNEESSQESPSKPNSSTSVSPTTLSEELLKQITAAAADSSDLKPESHVSTETEMEHQSTTSSTTTLEDPPPVQPAPQSTSIVNVTPQTPSTRIPVISGGGSTGKNRRKGRAFKLERLNEFAKTLETIATASSSPMEHSDLDDDGDHSSSCDDRQQLQPQVKKQPDQSSSSSSTVVVVDTAVQTVPARRNFECKYCDISFRDDVLYTIHMGYHGYDDVYKCNMCGEKSTDRIGFFLHIARKAH